MGFDPEATESEEPSKNDIPENRIRLPFIVVGLPKNSNFEVCKDF